ncbi:MAG: hypothetical protein N2C14_03725, partial [Planctomycetales bacterium]
MEFLTWGTAAGFGCLAALGEGSRRGVIIENSTSGVGAFAAARPSVGFAAVRRESALATESWDVLVSRGRG